MVGSVRPRCKGRCSVNRGRRRRIPELLPRRRLIEEIRFRDEVETRQQQVSCRRNHRERVDGDGDGNSEEDRDMRETVSTLPRDSDHQESAENGDDLASDGSERHAQRAVFCECTPAVECCRKGEGDDNNAEKKDRDGSELLPRMRSRRGTLPCDLSCHAVDGSRGGRAAAGVHRASKGAFSAGIGFGGSESGRVHSPLCRHGGGLAGLHRALCASRRCSGSPATPGPSLRAMVRSPRASTGDRPSSGTPSRRSDW